MDKKLKCRALEYLLDLMQDGYTFETAREGIEEGKFTNRIGYNQETLDAMAEICDEKIGKKPQEINWDVSKEDFALIDCIVRRALGFDDSYDYQELVMDVTATHANGCPLDLAALFAAEDFDFVHDVFGIYRNIDRETGKLKNCFRPRFAVNERSRSLIYQGNGPTGHGDILDIEDYGPFLERYEKTKSYPDSSLFK